MSYREFHYVWEYQLKSEPERLWSFVADTNRFNRDTGVPSIAEGEKPQRLRNARRRLRLSFLGLPVEWEEQPFEWIRPSRFGVTRKYIKGPVAELRMLAELTPQTSGGTQLRYQVWARPKTVLGFLVIPLQIGRISARRFASAFHRYDQAVASEETVSVADSRPELSSVTRSSAALDGLYSARRRLLRRSNQSLCFGRQLGSPTPSGVGSMFARDTCRPA